MIKNKTALQVKKGERIYEFNCDPDSPIGELYDALFEMQAYVVGRIQASQPKPEEPQEEACPNQSQE